jgi:hypothetical protein
MPLELQEMTLRCMFSRELCRVFHDESFLAVEAERFSDGGWPRWHEMESACRKQTF